MDESVYQEVYGILILAGHFNLAARLYEQKLFHKAAKKALAAAGRTASSRTAAWIVDLRIIGLR